MAPRDRGQRNHWLSGKLKVVCGYCSVIKAAISEPEARQPLHDVRSGQRHTAAIACESGRYLHDIRACVGSAMARFTLPLELTAPVWRTMPGEINSLPAPSGCALPCWLFRAVR